MVGQAEVPKGKVGKMWRKTEKEASHDSARPEGILQNAGRRGGTWRRDARNGKFCRVLGRHLRKRRKSAKHDINERDKETIKWEDQPS